MADPAVSEQYEWDLFVSYASEDREVLVKPLVSTLRELGLRPWWDELELKVGDSLLDKIIHTGLARSRFGVVVISPSFLNKPWPKYELTGLTTRELTGSKVVLPLWYGVTFQDVVSYSPPLADKKAIIIKLPLEKHTILEACIQILEAASPELLTRLHRRAAWELAKRRGPLIEADPRTFLQPPRRHDELPADLLTRVRLIRAALLTVYPHSMAFWEDGFLRDAHPSDEVRIWERIATAYLEYSLIFGGTEEERSAVFQFLQLLSADSKYKDDFALPEAIEENRDIIHDLLMYTRPVIDLNPEDEDPWPPAAPPEAEPSSHIEDFGDPMSDDLAEQVVDYIEDRLQESSQEDTELDSPDEWESR